MTFLALNETWDWCRTHGLQLDEHYRLPRIPHGSPHPGEVFFTFGDGQAVDHQEAQHIARRCLGSIGAWDELLLWVTSWGIWPDSEDWPAYYAARGSRGERRALDDAPGHLFSSGEVGDLSVFLILVIEHGWDAELLATNGTIIQRRFISHDGWFQSA